MASNQELQCLLTARSAVEQGLITASDYEVVKAGFLKAQQVKAGLDAGFILPEDYQDVKRAFLRSLEGLSLGLASQMHPAAHPLAGVEDGSNGQQSRAAADGGASAQPAGATQFSPRVSSGYAAPTGTTATQPAAPAAPEPPAARSRTPIPTNIPKYGGSRPKQTTGVSTSIWQMMC